MDATRKRAVPVHELHQHSTPEIRAALRRRIAAQAKEGEGGCLTWRGCCCNAGYPRVSFGGHSLRRVGVYALLIGEVPPGWMVTSECGQITCVDESCLQAFPRWALMAAKVGKKSADVVARMRSARWRTAPIGLEGAREIRRRYASGETITRLAAEFGIWRHSMADIVRGVSYREPSPFSGLGG